MVREQKASLCLLLFSILLLSNGSFGSESSKEEAYVTLLYGDEFLLGVRVLGKSIRDTGSDKDMVALVSDGVSDYSKKLLKADGWKVEKISLLANPNQVHPTRFWGVYTKLKIFNMTDYKKVVYLDADTIVVKNIEDLFKCSKFCANLKHSERLNSGVMVVEPSQALFDDMMRKVKTLSSYTGGDQGFLNSYYPDFPNARVFDPSLTPEALKARPVPDMERLSTLYNADVGLYMLANKWMVDESKLHVIHYTLGPLKPWDWWTAWLVKPVHAWHSIRVTLEETLPGTGGGKNQKDELVVKLLFLLPLCALLFCIYRSIQGREGSLCNQIRYIYYKIRSNGTLGYSGVSTFSTLNPSYQLQSKVPQHLGAVSVVVCFTALLISVGVSFLIVPRQIMPWTGLILVYEWTFTIFFLLFGCFLLLVHQHGKRMAIHTESSSLDDSGKGHQRGGVPCAEHPSPECSKAIEAADKEQGDIDPYSIYTATCKKEAAALRSRFLRIRHPWMWRAYDPCTERYSGMYFNSPEVQKAMHANTTGIAYPWKTCSDIVGDKWADSPLSMLPIYKELIGAGLRIWVFSGDTDSVVPITGTRYSIRALKLQPVSEWYPWYDNGQVGGWSQVYKGLTLVTIHGAGHEVPLHRPRRGFLLFQSFLNNKSM